MKMKVRINKYLADCAVSSRRKSEEFVLQGRVTVNNKTVKELAFKIDPDKDVVKLDGEIVKAKRNVYFLLNKPKGVITSTTDDKNRLTVTDLIKTSERIYPVGRLDYNTTGVLILTNDGEFSQLLTHPKNKIPRQYIVKLDKQLQKNDEIKLLKGIKLDNKPGRFLKIEFDKLKERKLVKIICEEGRNHFVKKMFNALGYRVIALHRESFAGIKAQIPEGTYRKLSSAEINSIKKTIAN